MPAKRKPGPDPLSTYRAKRSLDRTPEPGARPATPASSSGGLFVVHMHAARRLHWDLRLEMDGVLRSWAVPKGPSPNRADKRLAVHVEDHPLEYGDFEGIIPEGNYGAGAVIVWDRGRWVPLEDPHDGMQKGKLLFELHGYKLKGKWTLVKLKKGEKEWLLIKEKDGYAATDGALPPESVLSGLTVEELKAGKDRTAPVVKELARLKAPRRTVTLEQAEPMLAETREQPFSKPGWLFELKLDGYRVRAARQAGEARLVTRNGHDIAPAFPSSRAPWRRCRTRDSSWTVSWSCRMRRAGRASSASRTAPRCPEGSRCGAARSRLRRCCTCSICSRSRATTSVLCRSSRARPCSNKSCRAWARSSISHTSSRTAKRCMNRS